MEFITNFFIELLIDAILSFTGALVKGIYQGLKKLSVIAGIYFTT